MPPIEPLEESVAALLVHHGITQFEIADRAEVEERPTGKSSSPDRLLVEIERVRSRSIDEILGRLAMRVLMTRQDQRRRLAVPVLVVERLGDKTRRSVREFMSKYAPGHAWGLMDRSCAAALVIPPLKFDIDQPGNVEPRLRVRHTPTQLFSDLNQWMLKVVLLVDRWYMYCRRLSTCMTRRPEEQNNRSTSSATSWDGPPTNERISCVVQKVLIRRRRPPHKQANDAAHVYEVALITRDAWPQMAEVLARVEAGGAFPPKWFERARQTIEAVFLGPDAVGPEEVARIYQDVAGPASGPTEAGISRVLRQFFAATGLQRR